MIGFSQDDTRPSLVRTTVKTVAVIGVLSWLAAGWLASASRDQATLARLVSNVSNGFEDPLTTGSIAGRANSSRLDPCSTSRR